MPGAAQPRRGRPPKLSRERIVDAALDVLDEQGLDGLTMRALARQLGVDPMAVYRHFRDKDELLGALCDAVLADLPALDRAAAWEPQVRALAADLLARLLARPALLPVMAGAPVTPASLVVAGEGIGLLVDHGLPPAFAAAAFGAVFSYVIGHAVLEASAPAVDDVEGLRAAAGDAAHVDEALALLTSPGDFEFGLDLLLDGLRRRVDGA